MCRKLIQHKVVEQENNWSKSQRLGHEGRDSAVGKCCGRWSESCCLHSGGYGSGVHGRPWQCGEISSIMCRPGASIYAERDQRDHELKQWVASWHQEEEEFAS